MTLSRSAFPPWVASLVIVTACSLSGAARAETLSAEDAVSRAASQNPTLRAALLDSAAARQAVAAEKGSRAPTLAASLTGEYAEAFGSNGAAPSRSHSETIGASVALRYTTDVGTALELGTSTDTSWRSGTGSAGSSGPTQTALAYLTARQPLLKGAGTDAVLAPYVQAEASAVAAERERDLIASQTALDVLGAYWELWYAQQSVTVQEQSLAAAQRQLADAKARAEIVGTGSKVDVLQFSTSVASITDSLSQARATLSTRAIALGRVLGMDPEHAALLRATGTPPSLGAAPSMEALKRAVIDSSTELAVLRADLDATRARVRAAEDADQPRLDVFATISAGTLWANDDLPGLSLPGGRPAFSARGGLELELPFGGGRASADAARARTQLAAAEARYQARLDTIMADVSSLRVSLDAAAEQVALASETARMAGELAEAERQRLLLGTTTSSEVVKAEQTLREAELRQRRAVVNQVTSQFQLEHARGALLNRFAPTLGGRSS